MNAKDQSSPRVRQQFLVQFSIEAVGENAADAIRDALDEIVRNGLQSADVRAEEIPAQRTSSAAVAVGVPVRAAAHGSHDGFHGLYLG